MTDPFKDLAALILRVGEPPVCPSCRGKSVAFLAYSGSLSRALMRCGCGTSFLLWVDPPAPPGDRRSVVKVLVVEPDGDTRDMYSEALTQEGLKVALVGTAHDAMEKTFIWRPSVIATELRLPDLDGLELCRQLKRSPQVTDIPIMVVTADTRPQRLGDAKSLADSVVLKPCSLDAFVAEARRLAVGLHGERRFRRV